MNGGKKTRKVSRWKCVHGCNNETVGVPCPHLEELLESKTEKQKRGYDREVDIVFTDALEKYEKDVIRPIIEYFPPVPAEQLLQEKLRQYDLTPAEKHIIINKFVYGKTFRELGKDLKMSEFWTHGVYKKALKKLKEKGYK